MQFCTFTFQTATLSVFSFQSILLFQRPVDRSAPETNHPGSAFANPLGGSPGSGDPDQILGEDPGVWERVFIRFDQVEHATNEN